MTNNLELFSTMHFEMIVYAYRVLLHLMMKLHVNQEADVGPHAASMTGVAIFVNGLL
jgi:hypothetical protein